MLQSDEPVFQLYRSALGTHGRNAPGAVRIANAPIVDQIHRHELVHNGQNGENRRFSGLYHSFRPFFVLQNERNAENRRFAGFKA